MKWNLFLEIVAKLEKTVNEEDDLQIWNITRDVEKIQMELTYRDGRSLSLTVKTSSPEFIHASL